MQLTYMCRSSMNLPYESDQEEERKKGEGWGVTSRRREKGGGMGSDQEERKKG